MPSNYHATISDLDFSVLLVHLLLHFLVLVRELVEVARARSHAIEIGAEVEVLLGDQSSEAKNTRILQHPEMIKGAHQSTFQGSGTGPTPKQITEVHW